MQPTENRLWNSAQVARYVGVCQETVRRWTRTGKLRFERRLPGGSYRYAPEDVEAMLRGNGAPAPNQRRMAFNRATLDVALRRARCAKRNGSGG